MSFSENLILGQHGWFDGNKFKEYDNIHPHKGGARFRYSGLQKNFSFFITNLLFRIYQYDNSAGNATFYITDTNTSKITDSYIGESLIIKTNGAGTWNNFDLSPLLKDENIKNLLNSGDDFYIHMLTEADIGFYRTGTKTITLTVDWVYGYSSGTISNSQLNLNTIQTLNISPVDSSYSHEVIWQIQNTEGAYVQCGDTQTIAAGTKIATTDQYKDSSYLSNTYFKSTEKITKGKAILTTKNSSDDPLGSVEISFDIVIPDSLGAPKDISLEIKPQVFGNDPEGVFSESGLYVVNWTKIVWKGNANLQGDATLSSCELTYSGGLTGTETSSLDTDTEGQTITNSSLITCTLKITDSRGFSDSIEQTITPTVYNKPTVYFSYAKRTDPQWNEQPVSGKNALLKISISYTSLNNKNSIKSVSYLGQEVNNPLITYDPDPTSSNSLQAEFSNLSENEITFTVNVQDAATGEQVSNYVSIPAAFYILHIPKGGRGIGIGSVAENNYINCGWTLNLQKGFKIDNLDFSSITSEEDFQTAIGGPFLPLAGGTINGSLTINTDNSNILSISGQKISTNNDLTINANQINLISSNSLKYNDYDIYHTGNIFYSTAETDGTPSVIPGGSAIEGMIWLKPVT